VASKVATIVNPIKGFNMTSRRQFIQIVPLTGVALVVGCSEKAPAPAAPATPIAAAPTPAPVMTPPMEAAPVTPMASAPAAVLPLVDERDPTAQALGFVTDATKADTAKFTTYAAGQNCGNCVLYQAGATGAQGACPLFAGRNVLAKSWCGSYAKKAA